MSEPKSGPNIDKPDLGRRRFFLRLGAAATAAYAAPLVFRIGDEAEAKPSKRWKKPSKRWWKKPSKRWKSSRRKWASRRYWRRPKPSKRYRYW